MTRGTVLAYVLLGLPLAFAALPIYVHVPRFYAETAGMALPLLGAILLGARLLDAGIDPWLGWLADRVRRPTMVAVALLPFALGFVALLNPPETYVAAWLLASLALTYLGFSAASVAYQAWGADVGEDSAMRTRLTASREGFGLLGVVLASALPPSPFHASPSASRSSRRRNRCCPACAGCWGIWPSVACCWSLSPTALLLRCRRRSSS